MLNVINDESAMIERFMTVQCRNNCFDLVCLKGLRGKSLSSLKRIRQQSLALQKCIRTNNLSSVTMSFGQKLPPKWRCLAIMHRALFGEKQTQDITKYLIPTVKHGGERVMCGCCYVSSGPVHLAFVCICLCCLQLRNWEISMSQFTYVNDGNQLPSKSCYFSFFPFLKNKLKFKCFDGAFGELCINKCLQTSISWSDVVKKSKPKFLHTNVRAW